MTLFLARHASAGRRSFTSQNDLDRELDDVGRSQSIALAEWIASLDVSVQSIVSSRATRCRQTVEPLAESLGIEVETSVGLLEGSSTASTMDLVRSWTERDIVACSHGDIIPDIVRLLEMSGMRVEGERLWHKGATWVIESEGSAFVRARAVDPQNLV